MRLALIALAFGLLLAGCDGGSSSDDGVLRFGLSSPPRVLDPCFATDATSERVNRLLYRRLVEFDEKGLPIPGIATWTVLTPTHYRFRLGESGRDFTDGTWLTSADVAATYGFILDPANASPHRAQLSAIGSIATPDPDTIDFHLGSPDPLFPAYLAEGILPAAVIAAGVQPATEPLGSGPFRMLDWPEPGRLRLERRRDRLILELITVKDPNVRVMKLLRGEVSMLQNDLSPELVDYLAARPSIRVETRPGRNFSYLGFNLEDPLAGHPKVRRALAHALDREALLRYLFRDRGRTAESIFPPEHWAGHPDLKPYRHDPELARALLGSLGYGPENPLALTLKTSSDPFRLRLATAMQSQLAAVGIRLTIRGYDWGTFFGDVKEGRFQLYGLSWVGINTPDIFRYAFHGSAIPPNGANRGRYRHPETDRLIDAAARAPDLDGQARLYRELASRLHAELPYLPLWYEDQILVRRPEVRDYRLAPDGNYDGLEDVWLGDG
ncbi:ABC transporter substrate-binding protein [Thiocystis violacea]|uniref:ABC transporter substrate-binding protein n=1 Tax=Thiocystis violacea TaxID=13725 RepID=UPI001908112B|nr:ABC transporter substrate-binding protein [Thiocystis violacea]MBK1719834.1 peptide ABC transporter substrate-binding protein [Thiocystis violacea]